MAGSPRRLARGHGRKTARRCWTRRRGSCSGCGQWGLTWIRGLPEGNGGKSAAAAARPWTEDSKALLDKAARELFGVRPVGVDVDTRVRMTYRSEEHTSELQSLRHLVCRLL